MFEEVRWGYGTFGVGREVGPSEWTHHDLFFVHRGSVELEFPDIGRQLSLERGAGVLIWPHTRFHGQATCRQARCSIQHFRVEKGFVAPPFDLLQAQRCGFSVQTASPSRWLESCIEHAVRRERPLPAVDDSKLSRQALLTLVLAEGGFLKPHTQERTRSRIDLAALESWLRANSRRNPGVPEMAALSGLSSSRFRAVFFAEQGIPPGRFLMAFRELEARRRLSETDEPIKAVAAALGYADVVVFHRAFQSRTGQTPAQFRRKNRIRG